MSKVALKCDVCGNIYAGVRCGWYGAMKCEDCSMWRRWSDERKTILDGAFFCWNSRCIADTLFAVRGPRTKRLRNLGDRVLVQTFDPIEYVVGKDAPLPPLDGLLIKDLQSLIVRYNPWYVPPENVGTATHKDNPEVYAEVFCRVACATEAGVEQRGLVRLAPRKKVTGLWKPADILLGNVFQ